MRPDALPLRTEHWTPKAPLGEEIGWFRAETASVTLWYNGVHLDKGSSWTNLESAVEAAQEIVTDYRIPPSPEGEGMLVAILLTQYEEPKQRRGGQWEDANHACGLRRITRCQRLAWASTVAGGTLFALPPLQSFRFDRRFPVAGIDAADDASTLGAALRGDMSEIHDSALVRGVCHQGLELADVVFSIEPPPPDATPADRRIDGALVRACGTARFGLLPLPWAPPTPDFPRVDFYPMGDRVAWAPGSRLRESLDWSAAPEPFST